MILKFLATTHTKSEEECCAWIRLFLTEKPHKAQVDATHANVSKDYTRAENGSMKTKQKKKLELHKTEAAPATMSYGQRQGASRCGNDRRNSSWAIGGACSARSRARSCALLPSSGAPSGPGPPTLIMQLVVLIYNLL